MSSREPSGGLLPPVLVQGPGLGSQIAAKTAAQLELDWIPWNARGSAGSGVTDPARAGNSAAGRGTVVLVTEASDETLAAAMRPPAIACVEVDGCAASEDRMDLGIDEQMLSDIDRSDLTLLLSAATAYSTSVAHHFCRALGERLSLGRAASAALELAVHEAVANAIVHGSLGVESFARGPVGSFVEYCEEIQERLADPAYGQQRIWLSARWDGSACEVVVHDQGGGYSISGGDLPSAEAAPMRGLALIRQCVESLNISDEGRRLTMSFVW